MSKDQRESTSKKSVMKSGLVITIYYDELGKCRQVIRPTAAFEGSAKDLVMTVSGGNFHAFSSNQREA